MIALPLVEVDHLAGRELSPDTHSGNILTSMRCRPNEKLAWRTCRDVGVILNGVRCAVGGLGGQGHVTKRQGLSEIIGRLNARDVNFGSESMPADMPPRVREIGL
jgi:hypothetical protein